MNFLNKINKYFLTSLVYSLEFGCVFLIRSSLVFVLFSAFALSDSNSFAIYTIYAIIIYSGTIVGSYIADKLLTLRLAWLLGFLITSSGCLLGAVNVGINLNLFYFALVLITTGGGIMKCGSLVITNDHIKEELKPEAHYDGSNLMHTILVVIMFISLSMGGIIKNFANNATVFYMAAFILFCGAIVFIISEYKKIKIDVTEYLFSSKYFTLNKKFILLAILGLMWIGCFILFYNHNLSIFKHLPLIVFAGFYLYLFLRALKNKAESGYIYSMMIYSFITVFYVSLEKQLDTVFALFATRNVDRVIMGYEIPTLNINSLFSIAVFLFGLIFFKYKLNSRVKESYIVYMIIGSLVFTFATLSLGCFFNQDGIVNLTFYVGALIFMAIGDVLNYARLLGNGGKMPHSLKSLIASFMMLNIAFGFYFAKIYASFAAIDKNVSDKIYSLNIYQLNFEKILLISVSFLFLIFILNKTRIGKIMYLENIK